MEHDGTITVLASHFDGKRFNSPNDVVVRSDGSIYFSDPHYGFRSKTYTIEGQREMDEQNVYRLDPEAATSALLEMGSSCRMASRSHATKASSRSPTAG